MEVTILTWAVALAGVAIIGALGVAQIIALLRPRARWTIEAIYGGRPEDTDPVAYFAFNQGFAWVDAVFWLPLQLVGSFGMVLGAKWGFLLALMASVPFWYSAVPLLIWNRALGIQKNTARDWIAWGVFPAYGLVSGGYCLGRLLSV